ncbi:hypothetical protein M7775_02145 [Sporomusa sphaeroides DSM 2875]|uniref:hypothetical protein n=1 Tax=Sporomusa sphaeroides TaxID=47679 RepID=UPI00202ED14D|nr:hypothetical protein [Sporomusa sphaeroides]MCM0757369.1 hypothetical protein [Sporomusa sphaeroides DSM 2875]
MNRIDELITELEESGLRVKEYHVADENHVYEVNTPSGSSIGKGPVTILVIRGYDQEAG